MAQVELLFNSIKAVMQCSNDDTIKNNLNKYIIKTGSIYNFIYLLFDSKILTKENINYLLIKLQIMKTKKKMTLLQYENNLPKGSKY
jgi:hypothetical protein